MKIELHDDAFEEVREQFIAAGALPPDVNVDDMFSVGDLTFLRWRYIPTAEQIERQKAFLETPFGAVMAKLFVANNSYLEKLAENSASDNAFLSGEQWPVGTTLKIRLPNDYKEV